MPGPDARNAVQCLCDIHLEIRVQRLLMGAKKREVYVYVEKAFVVGCCFSGEEVLL